jgi:iron complex transport system substrate-binding protein
MQRSAALLAPLVLVTALTAGCASSAKTAGTGATPTSGPSAEGTFPVTVDGATLSAKPTHVVSLSPTATDMLFAIGAGAQVVAVDKNSDYFGSPAPATTPPADLDAYTPSAEAISAKNPDLVVIANDTNKIKEQLEKLKIPVYVAAAAVTVDDTYRQETALGALTGHQGGAKTVVDNEKSQIAALVARVPSRTTKLSYYYELDQTYYTVTSKTFIGSLFAMAGMTNIADPSDADGKAFGYPQLSAEVIVKANPDLIFLADTQCCKQSLDTVKARAGWAALSAVTNSRVVAVGDDVASQWGTRVPDLLKTIVDADAAVPTS